LEVEEAVEAVLKRGRSLMGVAVAEGGLSSCLMTTQCLQQEEEEVGEGCMFPQLPESGHSEQELVVISLSQIQEEEVAEEEGLTQLQLDRFEKLLKGFSLEEVVLKVVEEEVEVIVLKDLELMFWSELRLVVLAFANEVMAIEVFKHFR
jgi:hypothetical protein